VHIMRRWHLLDRDSGGRSGDVWKVRRRQVLGYHRGIRIGGMRGLRSREVLDGIGRDRGRHLRAVHRRHVPE
jgi:hypothetical protein